MRVIRWVLVLLGSAAVMIGLAAPAWAHVEVSPPTAAAGALTTFTVTVPNELADQATVSLDLTLPDGVELDSAQSLPGWTTTVVKRPDGTAESVRWSGGTIPVGTFTTFQVMAKVPATATSLTWNAIQHYEHTTVAWTGAPDSEQPAAVTKIGPAAADGSPAAVVGEVPAAAPAGGTALTDELARSRAALSLVVGGAGAVIALAALVLLAALYRRKPVEGATPAVAATQAAGRNSSPKQRAGR